MKNVPIIHFFMNFRNLILILSSIVMQFVYSKTIGNAFEEFISKLPSKMLTHCLFFSYIPTYNIVNLSSNRPTL